MSAILLHSACSESVGGPSGAARGAVAALAAHPRRRQEVSAAADGPPGQPQNAAERHVSLPAAHWSAFGTVSRILVTTSGELILLPVGGRHPCLLYTSDAADE